MTDFVRFLSLVCAVAYDNAAYEWHQVAENYADRGDDRLWARAVDNCNSYDLAYDRAIVEYCPNYEELQAFCA